jgi:solute:Na+ symporter, SSS family
VLALLAWAFSLVTGQMLWVVFKVAGVTFGSLLGVFLLGLATTCRVADGANVAAMVVMALVNLTLLVLSEMQVLAFAWSWLVVVGTIGTMLLALVFSGAARRVVPRPA